MKPTEHIAKPADTPKTGRFALLRGPHRVPGSGASARSLVAAPLVALCVLLALCVGAAQAETPKLVSYGSFSEPEARGAGVAVGPSGDPFVSGVFDINEGLAPAPVFKFDPSGKSISPPSPFGSAFGSGIAVSPANGDVYVLGEEGLLGLAMIFVYDPDTGALLSSFEVPASRNLSGIFTVLQIAADAAGDVYVPVEAENEVLEYDPATCPAAPTPCTPLKTFTGGSGAGALKAPTGVAVDSSGNVWVADSGNNRIVELDPSGAPVEVNGKPVEIESEGVSSVALDGHGDVYAIVENAADPCGGAVSPCVHLVEYSAEGRQLADVGAGRFGELKSHFPEAHYYSQVAVNQADGRVYVMDGLKETVWIFGPPVAPAVDRELVSEVGASEAKLGALVNPGGIPATYRFEYGPTSAYGSSTPSPEGSVGEGVQSHAVWASASGLGPGTTYHYRVIASNELGTVAGPDQTFTTLSAEQAACPNEPERSGFSGRLPDCRAYELVTPPVTSTSQFDARGEGSAVAENGEAISLFAENPRPGAPSAGEEYVATRGASGWTAEDVMPLESYDGVACAEFQKVYDYSDQLGKEVMRSGGGSRATGFGLSEGNENPESCNPEGSQIVSGEPVGYENLLVRDNATGAYQLVNLTPPGVTPADAQFKGASPDLSRVVFTETSPLAEGAQYGVPNLYEWDEGTVRLASVLPDGTDVTGTLAAVPDGSHVLFTSAGALYERIDGHQTVQVDEAQGGAGASSGGTFQGAPDGSHVFFTDESQLTGNSTAAAGEPDLYECTLPEGASKCELSDLTVAAGGEHADVLGVAIGRHNSSYVYFTARGVLATNTREYSNAEGETVVEGAENGQSNLYVWHDGTTAFIARSGLGQLSPDGRWIAFGSTDSLTGYNNAGATELFLYGADTAQLACASCNPTGEAPAAPGVGAVVVTDGGRVFFETGEALVPSDTNGRGDVYEYEGGTSSSEPIARLAPESNLLGASESGDDVFVKSIQQLVPEDNQEGQTVIYDARVDGGFAEPSAPPLCTTADACRAPVSPQPSIYGAPSSQTFSGAGNLAPPPPTVVKKVTKKTVKCKQGLVKNKQGKCVKRPKKKKKTKAKRATNDRRGKS